MGVFISFKERKAYIEEVLAGARGWEQSKLFLMLLF